MMGSCISAAILVFNIAVVVLVAVKPGFNGDTAVLPFTYDSVTMYVYFQISHRQLLTSVGLS